MLQELSRNLGAAIKANGWHKSGSSLSRKTLKWSRRRKKQSSSIVVGHDDEQEKTKDEVTWQAIVLYAFYVGEWFIPTHFDAWREVRVTQ